MSTATEVRAICTFRDEGWMRLPAFAAPARLDEFRRNVLASPMRRVTVGRSGEQWSEYALPESSALGGLLAGEAVFALAQDAVSVPLKRAPALWAQAYRVGERIAWHCDNSGEVQFLICIEAPPRDQGGVFCMRVKSGEIGMALRPGDALLFRASQVPHSTTRLVSLPGRPEPSRITAVARFFA